MHQTKVCAPEMCEAWLWVSSKLMPATLMVQATEKVMEMYQEASEMRDAAASADEAGKAAMQLARLCDELLKVCSTACECFCKRVSARGSRSAHGSTPRSNFVSECVLCRMRRCTDKENSKGIRSVHGWALMWQGHWSGACSRV